MHPPQTSHLPPHVKVRGTRASSVILHHVPTDCVKRFLEWERGITNAAAEFPGYQATDMYPPADPTQLEWVVVIHFEDHEALRRWLESPARAEWTANLPAGIADFRLKTLATGFGPWFAGLVDDGLPSHWKMAFSVLLPLYPTVMLVAIFISPHTSWLGMAVSVLISNIVSVCLLEWVIMPLLRPLLRPWFKAQGAAGRTTTVLGLAIVVAVLALLTLVFHRATT